ncbi:glycerophosphoryl diester phosphodiesterase membrane domain-containing protein [Flammeovirga yaeyamensis]|uniref:Glycerophosphoryl diester phosphodiesterase membrane domain-containing protein n=1 Tax=Flammeovirga yaeyamensis TaxID=367791 RepID=A0AAX1NAQ1_9BACT|nr:glycerophosphoryl diester phosphodiesterase membrane domain-containing protein [Flammeovirga yaeyamensis]MBB3699520.1 hypothetical protein [Flammeovirga yaeyamensis]NMF35224.1 hypothetical protein [Flammeovirga yaeyamensis]QWG04086.1 glycerophosphoryl diester phosphodiesterase membrane domain-containing protein [Flammeovirga yaeyamensis]
MKRTYEFNQVRDLGDKIDFTFSFFKENFKKIFKSCLTMIIPLTVIGSGISTGGQLFFAGEAGLSTTFAMFGGILQSIATAMLAANIFVLIRGHINGKDLSPVEINNEAKEYTTKIFFGSILYGICVVIGMIFFVIPGFFLAIAWAVLLPLIVFEEKSITEAMSRSNNLVSGNWWATFFYFFILGIIVFGINYVFTIIPAGLVGVGAFFQFSDEGSLNVAFKLVAVLISMGVGIISPIVKSAYHIGTSTQYFSLKEKKEASSIMRDLNALD